MTEKEKLFTNLIDKSEKSREELEELVADKVNELSGLVSEEGAIYIIANELGIRLENEKPKKNADFLKLDKITEPKTPVSFLCKIIRKYDIVTFSSEKNPKGRVQSILVGDETGVKRLTFWNDQTEILENIQEGDILKILNAYTRENTQNPGRIDIHYGQYSDIEVNPKDVEVKVQEFTPEKFDSVKKKISEIEEGERNIELDATVTDFDIPRFYIGCPECFRKVFQDGDDYKCAEHGEVKPLKIPIVNLIIDDGSGTIAIVGFRDRAEKLTEMTSDDIIKLTEDIDTYQTFSKKIIGSKINLIGNHSINNMTGEKQLIVNQILGVEFKELDEVVEDILKDDVKEKSNSKEVEDDLEIEEIDLDDDLM